MPSASDTSTPFQEKEDISSFLVKSPGQFFFQRRTCPGGKGRMVTLQMAKLPPGRPAERLQSKENFYQDTQSRLCYSVGLYRSDMLNYTVGLVPSPGWRYRSANGSWTGMMEEHRTGRVQIAVSAFIVLEQRMDVIDYTGPTYKYKYHCSLEPAPQLTERLLKSYTQD